MPVFDDKTTQEDIRQFNEYLKRDREKRYTSEKIATMAALASQAKLGNEKAHETQR